MGTKAAYLTKYQKKMIIVIISTGASWRQTEKWTDVNITSYPDVIDGSQGVFDLASIVREEIGDFTRAEVIQRVGWQSKDLEGHFVLLLVSANTAHFTIDQALVGNTHLHRINQNPVIELQTDTCRHTEQDRKTGGTHDMMEEDRHGRTQDGENSQRNGIVSGHGRARLEKLHEVDNQQGSNESGDFRKGWKQGWSDLFLWSTYLGNICWCNDQWFPSHCSDGRSKQTGLFRVTCHFIEPMLLQLVSEMDRFILWKKIVEIRFLRGFLFVRFIQ